MSHARAELYHQLSTMFEAGLPTVRALEIVAKQTRGRLGRALAHMTERAREGGSLASTMEQHPEAFSPIETLTVEAAEISGDLPATFRRLSDYYTSRERVRHTISAGLVYPLVVFHLAALIVPVLSVAREGFSLGGYLLNAVAILLMLYVPAALIWYVVRYTPKTGPLRGMLDAFALRIPLLGKAMKHLALSRFARAFQILYRTGSIPVGDCIERASTLSGNATVRRWFVGGAASARAGQPIWEGFSRRAPEVFRDRWAVGEETGKLEEVAGRLADEATEESERHFIAFAAWFPRIVYALIAIFIIINIFRGFAQIYGGYGQLLDE